MRSLLMVLLCALFLLPVMNAGADAFLGVSLEEKDGRAVAGSIVPKSPADESGILPGDVLLSIDGKEFESLSHTMSTIKEADTTKSVELVVERAGEKKTLKVTLKARPKRSSLGEIVPLDDLGKAPPPKAVPVTDLEPSRVTLDLKQATVREIVREIEKQTGNTIKIGKALQNRTLPTFQADGETFWEVLDRLGKESGNRYGEDAFGGG